MKTKQLKQIKTALEKKGYNLKTNKDNNGIYGYIDEDRKLCTIYIYNNGDFKVSSYNWYNNPIEVLLLEKII